MIFLRPRRPTHEESSQDTVRSKSVPPYAHCAPPTLRSRTPSRLSTPPPPPAAPLTSPPTTPTSESNSTTPTPASTDVTCAWIVLGVQFDDADTGVCQASVNANRWVNGRFVTTDFWGVDALCRKGQGRRLADQPATVSCGNRARVRRVRGTRHRDHSVRTPGHKGEMVGDRGKGLYSRSRNASAALHRADQPSVSKSQRPRRSRPRQWRRSLLPSQPPSMPELAIAPHVRTGESVDGTARGQGTIQWTPSQCYGSIEWIADNTPLGTCSGYPGATVDLHGTYRDFIVVFLGAVEGL